MAKKSEIYDPVETAIPQPPVDTSYFRSAGGPLATNDWYKQNGSDTTVYNNEPSLTRQEFAAECDINTIMERYQTTGVLPVNNAGPAVYLDWTELPDTLQGTLNFMAEAESSFNQLPAKVRREFDNDPARFVEYAADPNNLEQMRDWGLAPPKVEPGEVFVPVPPAPEKAGDKPPAPGT